MAQCHKCDNPLSYVNLENMSIHAKPQNWHGVAYVCPYCRSVLSVAIDPITLKNDTVTEIVDRLRRG